MGDITVLYAEDDENDAFFMERAFSKMKAEAQLRVVGNGRLVTDYLQAVGAFSDRERFPPPTLLLLDVKMPEMSGLEALQWARERGQFDDLPVVMFTSSTQHTDIEFCAAHGASAYLTKPSRADQLEHLMGKIIAATMDGTAGRRPLNVPGNQLLESH
jgi:CheY-like chemotaxis protein